MQLKNISKWMVIAGTLMIWVVKFYVRPYIHIPLSMQLLVNTAPNLIGSFLLPFGAYWFFKKIFRLEDLQDVRVTCLFGLVLVIVNEYLQLIPFFGRTFDYYDIIFSFIGTFAGYKTFAHILLKSADSTVSA